MKRFMIFLLIVVVAVGIGFAVGPREPVDETIAFDASTLGNDIDAYLASSEALVPDVREGAQKRIIWVDPASKAKTPLAIVYIHGFSASLEEVRPLPDIVARDLGANLYFARLRGHGRSGAAMATATVNGWFNDVAEAVAIGRRLGDRVVLLSTSTGGTLATWALEQPALAEGIVGSVMISPNFAVQAAGADSLLWPWARQLVPMVFGENRAFKPLNDEQGKWWTTEYPTVSLLPMQASVARAGRVPVEDITVPALFIYHPDDAVVKSSVTRQIAARWGATSGAKATSVEVETSDDPFNHVIAGRILSPSTTEPLAARIVTWVQGL